MKPEFYQDEKLAPCSPVVRFVFLGLISLADDAGRLVDNVKSIDGFMFPLSDDSSAESLITLQRLGRIIRYRSSSGQALLQIANWEKHQKVKNPSKYNLPGPTNENVQPTEALRTLSVEPTENLTPLPYIPDPRPTIIEQMAFANANEDDPRIEEAGNEIGAVLAPLIRQHLWLTTQSRPPAKLLTADAKWSMARELDIARQFLGRGETTAVEIAGAVRMCRKVLNLPRDAPLTMKVFNVRDRHDRMTVCVQAWRKNEQAEARKNSNHVSRNGGGRGG